MQGVPWNEVLNVVQVLGLAFIAAWQQRAAHIVRRQNGKLDDVHADVRKLAGSTRADEDPATGGS
jgi:hypothetical protein